MNHDSESKEEDELLETQPLSQQLSVVDEEQPAAASKEDKEEDESQPLISHIIYSEYYTKSEGLAINFHILPLLVQLFIPNGEVAASVGLILFLVLVVAPSAFIFSPLDIMLLQCFTKQQLMKCALKLEIVAGWTRKYACAHYVVD